MKKDKKIKLEKAGYKVGNADEFLGRKKNHEIEIPCDIIAEVVDSRIGKENFHKLQRGYTEEVMDMILEGNYTIGIINDRLLLQFRLEDRKEK